jgi:hypothetical protein
MLSCFLLKCIYYSSRPRIAPNYFIDEIFFSKYIIQYDLYVGINVPIYMIHRCFQYH